MFLNRQKELEALRSRFRSERPEFAIIYGRRRVGKSELIEHFLTGRPGVRLLAREEAEGLQIKRFSESLANYFKDEVIRKNPLTNWDALFTYIAERAKKRFILAIDEFPYLVTENKAIPSILQDFWDTKLRHTKIFLILCGSSIGMMEGLLGGRSPLYGRRTAQILVSPFSFMDAYGWLNTDIQRAVQAFCIFGGTPAYLLEFDKKASLWDNIRQKILRKDAFLYKDAEFILREELTEPRYYFSILSSIAKGKTRLSEIINDTGLDKGIVGKYLSVLSELQLIERLVPVTERRPEKSRKGIYRLRDNFFRFWFRYVWPHLEYVETDQQGYLLDRIIKPTFDNFVGQSFEDIMATFLMELSRQKMLPAHFTKIGRWWDRGKEIDLIALNEETYQALFCEVKWRERVNAEALLKKLRENAMHVDWHTTKRKEYYCIVAKSFIKKTKDAILIDLGDIKRMLKSSLSRSPSID